MTDPRPLTPESRAVYMRALQEIMAQASYLPIRSPERRIIEDAVMRGFRLYREDEDV